MSRATKRDEPVLNPKTAPTTQVARAVLELQCALKLYHWKTSSYARHVASDELVASVQRIGDALVEAMVTRYGRPGALRGSLSCPALTDESVPRHVQEACGFWTREFTRMLHPEDDTDLLSLRDELVAALHKALYLMTLS